MKFFTSIPRWINILAASALLLTILKLLWFDSVPEFFPGGHEIGVVVEPVLISVLASYLFYLVVVHQKERTEQRIMLPMFTKWSSRLAGDCRSILKACEKEANARLCYDELKKDSLTPAFKKINPYHEAPLLFHDLNRNASWLEYLDHYRRRSKKQIDKIIMNAKYADAELVGLCNELDDCTYFFIIESATETKIKNTDISFLATSCEKYHAICKRIERWAERNKQTQQT